MPLAKKTDASSFATALCAARLPSTTISVGSFVVKGRPGVTHRIQYNRRDGTDLLDGAHEYTFSVGKTEIQTSLQLYENVSNHHRLFCYTRVGDTQGMTFSMNLTTGRCTDGKIALRQRIKFADRHPEMVDGGRRHRAESQRIMCGYLARIGLSITNGFDVDLGQFDPVPGNFVGTTADRFLNDFLAVSLVKGHYQDNKNYHLPSLPLLSK